MGKTEGYGGVQHLAQRCASLQYTLIQAANMRQSRQLLEPSVFLQRNDLLPRALLCNNQDLHCVALPVVPSAQPPQVPALDHHTQDCHSRVSKLCSPPHDSATHIRSQESHSTASSTKCTSALCSKKEVTDIRKDTVISITFATPFTATAETFSRYLMKVRAHCVDVTLAGRHKGVLHKVNRFRKRQRGHPLLWPTAIQSTHWR